MTPEKAEQPTRLLIVEDDQRIAKLLQQFLRSEHFAVDWLQSGEEAVDYIRQTPPDLVILDLMLPKMDGVEVCSAIRPDFDKGILMLTAHEGDIIEVTALNAGVDDFLCKPVRTHVLLARLNALLRRQSKPRQSVIQVQDLLIDQDKRAVSRNGQKLPLGEAEFELLWQLAIQAGAIVKRDDLFHLLRGKEYDGLDRSIDMRVSKLRKKLSQGNSQLDYIRTIRQLGYVLVKD
ncbi:response regulator transcription factor [Thalassomonas haliotis]|uniref:Response regulator transcription factor n=1 Tax=Thalassomonas haliotis TaxID=485448 RepID=A0ABY7V8U9_9GAMM|nr:response regulator transcription factor [Thalassomonas haliotis]WDE10019.1 response regulator transcription factor [Thalassomonas haliotis]